MTLDFIVGHGMKEIKMKRKIIKINKTINDKPDKSIASPAIYLLIGFITGYYVKHRLAKKNS